MAKLRVLLADDHPVVRTGLKTLINAQPDMEVEGEAADGRVAWELAVGLRPDVVVMDVSMPELGGAQATARLKRECPDIKVLALTVHEDKGYLRQLLAAGASGYVLKRAAAEELVQAIRAVAAGGLYLDPSVADGVIGGFVHKPPSADSPRGGELTAREAEVLRLIARGFSNKVVADRLGISVKTVESYKARALEKLGLKNRADIVRHALREGWLEDV